MLFGKKPLPYEPEHFDANNHHNDVKTVDKTGLHSHKPACDMPPLVVQDTKSLSQENDNVSRTLSAPSVKAENTTHTPLEQPNNRDIASGGKPTIVEGNVPIKPNTPDMSSIPSIPHMKGNVPKGGCYDIEFNPKDRPRSNEFGTKPYVWKPAAPKISERDVVAFVVENSNDTLEQKESIVNIISQTVERKKDAIFLFIKVGNEQTPFSPMDYSTVKEKNIIPALIVKSEGNELPNLASALFYLVNNLNVFAADTFSFHNTNYKLKNCSIVCIGTGACIQNDSSAEIVSSCISKLQKISKLKAFKYFCIKDSDAIRVSALGFPVIGHIVSNFYE